MLTVFYIETGLGYLEVSTIVSPLPIALIVMRNCMEALPIDLNEGLQSFVWSENSILFHVDTTTPSQAIYQAVCDEIGRFYQTKGFKYAPGSKKLQHLLS